MDQGENDMIVGIDCMKQIRDRNKEISVKCTQWKSAKLGQIKNKLKNINKSLKTFNIIKSFFENC